MATVNPSEVHKEGFRPELLSLRRRMLGLSQAELSARAAMAQGTLSKLEQGLREAPDELIARLGEALNCPISFFYQSEREYGPPMSAHPMFRKKTSVGQKVLDRVIAELNVRIGHARTFLGAVDFVPELPLPQYHIEDFEGDIEAIAANVRRAWYVPRGPLKSLTEFVERAGCLVIKCEMEAARIDGMSYRIPGLPPVIFLNRNQPADRLRFSLAHELGHLILHSYPSPEMEREADQFASALLMPKDDIAPELSRLTLEKAAYMKPVWRVSMAALIVRATTLGKIDQNKAQYLWRIMSVRGYRLREPVALDFEAEQPTLLQALIANLTDSLDYSPGELEKVLHLGYQELAELYGLPRQSTLRVVK
jgi:Zn-dependent peptidase ImmA (M78 family)/transcriptional regulator with XRE-family HTH domain